MKESKFLAAMLMALAFGMAIIGCDQATGPEEQQEQGSEQPAEEGAAYVGATEDGTPVELFIEGGTYAVTVGGEEVSRGTVTEAADGAWTLQPEEGEAFTAKVDEDGLTLDGPITDDIDGEDLRELYPVETPPPSDVEADYRISLDAPAVYVFPSAAEGYAEAEALTVTITNTGSQKTGKLTVALSGTDSGSFKLGKLALASIAADGSAAFTVTPKTKLAAGTYNAKVTVSGTSASISAAFNVRFTVNEPEEPVDPPEDPVYGISLDVSGNTFPHAIEGYGAQEPLAVTITNTGTAETGKLTLNVSNTDFTLNKKTIDNIAVEGEDSFTVVPKTGLKAGTYTATVTVSGEGTSASNIEEQSFEVSFDVGAAVYGIDLSQKEDYAFPDATFGYSPLTARAVAISNTGNQPTGALTLNVSNAVPSGGFRLDKETIASIAVGGTAGFTVVPAGGLGAGTYTATVTVSGSNGISAAFGVSFEVRPVPAYGITLSETETYTFPAAILGYGALPPQAIAVTNKGNQPTGGLAIGVTGNDFTLDKQTIDSLAVDGTAEFTVVPNTGLAVGSYTATVSVTGGNGISASFEVSFTVTATYGITLNQTEDYQFPAAILGYGAQAVKTVNITNSGNQPTGALTVSAGADFEVTAPENGAVSGIPVNGTADFSVRPKTGLGIGPHTATVAVGGSNGISASFNVSFTVTATYGISLSQAGTFPFPPAILGYPAQAAKAITISNTGNQPTGALTVALTGANPSAFTLDPQTTVASIAAGTTGSFTVTPNLGLSKGPHTATVTVSGDNGIFAGFNVSFEVTAVYGINLSRTVALIFDDAIEGYDERTPQSITISNTGNQPTGGLTVSAGTDFEVTAPENGAVTSIPVGETATFSVRPKTGLGAGPHSATVTVSGDNGISRSFGVSLVVIAATYGISLDVSGPHTFPEAIFGYPAQDVKTVNITNTGNHSTGALTVSAGTDFEVTAPENGAVSSIPAGDTAAFSVRPKTGLAKGTHTATVTVSDGNNISASFGVSFEVTATYGISLSQTVAHIFPEAELGYGAQTAKTVTITNTGNQSTGALAVALTGANYGSFTVAPTTVASIAAGGSAPFTVVPKTGLAINTYTATVTVSGSNGISASFGVSFEVMPPQTFSGLITLLNANANSASVSYILPSGNETYTSAVSLTTENCPATVVIDGGGRVITGSTNRITVGAGLTLTLRNITFTNIPFTVAAGGKLTLDNGAVVRQNAGTGVTVSGTLEMKAGSLVTGNSASGVRIEGTGGVFTMEGGTISYNTGGINGGVALNGANTVFTMSGGEISSNTSGGDGAGVRIKGAGSVFNMNGGKISGNIAANYGGGVLVEGSGSVFTMTSGEISGNSAANGGGGVTMWERVNVTFNMEGGIIKNNSAGWDGGGVQVLRKAVFNMTGGEITGNSAGIGGGVYLGGSGTLTGNPSTGSKVSGRGSIYNNTPQNVGAGSS